MKELPPLLLIAGWAHGKSSLQALAARLVAFRRLDVISVHDLVDGLPQVTHGAQPTGLGLDAPSAYARGLAQRLAREPVPAILAGWSMGGMVALETAIAFPHLVGRLVLVGATARFCATRNYPHGTPPAALRAMIAGLRRDREETLRRFFAMAHGAAANENGQLRREETPDEAALNTESLVSGLEYLQAADFRARLGEVVAPTLVIHGRQDEVIPWQAGQVLCDGIPNSRLVVDDGPHALPIDAAEWVSRSISEFLSVMGGTSLRNEGRGLALHHALRSSGTCHPDETSTALHFSRAARVYHARADLHREIAARLLERLAAAPAQPQANGREQMRILELGCGTGFLTAGLRRLFPAAQIDAVDISPAMIDEARRHGDDGGRTTWHVCDAWHYRAARAYDLIASSSAMQWMQPLDALAARLAAMLEPGGQLLCALMLDGTLRELHRLRKAIAPGKLPHKSLPASEEMTAGLQNAGFRLLHSERQTVPVEYPSSEAFLRTIRELGFTGGPLSTAPAPLVRGELQRLIARYREEFTLPGGRVSASYVVGYFHAICGPGT